MFGLSQRSFLDIFWPDRQEEGHELNPSLSDNNDDKRDLSAPPLAPVESTADHSSYAPGEAAITR